jgi:hypothetical protein
VVVAEIEGVVKFVPVPKLEPPDDAEYQLIPLPALAVALKVVEPGPEFLLPDPQKLLGVVLSIDGLALTVAITGVLEAVVHPLNVAST